MYHRSETQTASKPRRIGLFCAMIGILFLAPSLWLPRVRAGTATYEVVGDTSSLAGTMGYLEFQFNPGGAGAAPAIAVVSGFLTNGLPAGTSTTTNDASGVLPGTLSFDNLTGYNDLYQVFTYGTYVDFDITLSGSAVGNPPSGTTTGTTFAFFFEDGNGNGLSAGLASEALDLNINANGTTSAIIYAPLGVNGPTVSVSGGTVPEPSSSSMLGMSLIIIVGAALVGRSRKGTCPREGTFANRGI